MTRRTKWTVAITAVVVFCLCASLYYGVGSKRKVLFTARARPLDVEKPVTTERPAGPLPAPSTSAVAEEVLSNLRPGKITYDPPRKMKVAVPTSILVRIGKLTGSSPESESRLDAALTKGLERPALAPKPIRVSTTMKAILTGPKDEFQIDLQSPEEQIISIDEPTEWRWSVTPLKAGKRRLHLSAVAVVKIEGTEKVKEYGVFDTDITVQVNFIHYLTEHWKEISSAVSGTGLIGWLLARFKKRKRLRTKHRKANA